MIGFIITLIVVGLIAGALARLIVPGRQNMLDPDDHPARHHRRRSSAASSAT